MVSRPRKLRPFFPLSFAFLLLSAVIVPAQTFEPITTGFGAEIKVWSSSGTTFVKVRLTFPNTGHSVSDWGQVTRVGNDFIADAKVQRYTGGSGQAITLKENTYVLGTIPAGRYTFTFKSHGTPVKSEQFDPSLVVEHWEATTLPADRVYLAIWTQEGITRTRVNFVFPDDGYAVTDWGQFTRSGNEFSIDTKVERSTSQSPAHTNIVDRSFELGALGNGAYTLTVKIYGTAVKSEPFSVTAGQARAPRLLTEESSERALALDSVTWMRQFPLETSHNFSSDRRVRILLLATDVELSTGDGTSELTAYAEDAEHRIHPMTVEYVGTVPGFAWLVQIVVRPPDELQAGGEIGVILSNRGMLSNKVLLKINPSTATSQ